jgi:hypothetical protein
MREKIITHRQQHVALVSACGEDRKHRNKSRLESESGKTSKMCRAKIFAYTEKSLLSDENVNKLFRIME